MIRPEFKYDTRTGEKYAGFKVSIPFEKMTAIFKRIGQWVDRFFGDDAPPSVGTQLLRAAGSTRQVKASIFAGPTDVRKFREAKAKGWTDEQAFRVGDNGVGCYGDDTAGAIPMVALPPEIMVNQWGSVKQAKHRAVRVVYNGTACQAIVADRMPHLENITNGCRIDLNWALAQALGIKTENWTGIVQWTPLS